MLSDSRSYTFGRFTLAVSALLCDNLIKCVDFDSDRLVGGLGEVTQAGNATIILLKGN